MNSLIKKGFAVLIFTFFILNISSDIAASSDDKIDQAAAEANKLCRKKYVDSVANQNKGFGYYTVCVAGFPTYTKKRKNGYSINASYSEARKFCERATKIVKHKSICKVGLNFIQRCDK